jgi:hypothetical protein
VLAAAAEAAPGQRSAAGWTLRALLEKALRVAAGRDPECMRAEFDIRSVLRTPEEVFTKPGLRGKTLELGSGWRDAPPLGPTRQELLALVS